MIIGFILGLVLLGLIATSVLSTVIGFKSGDKKKSKVGIICAAVLTIAFIIIPFSFHTVDTGNVAVVKRLGEAIDVKAAGTHFNLWFIDSYQRYDSKVQNVEINTMTYSSDAQTMDVQMTIQYQIISEKVVNIAKQYGSLELLQNRIESIAIEKTKAVLSAHKAMDIIANRAAMSPAVEQAIKNAIGEEYFVNVTAVVLTNIDFSDAFETAVEEKMIAEQKQLKAEYENKTKIAQAEANAKSKIVAAEAEAKANELLEKSLTDKILREMYIEKWDGKLPQTVAGESSTIMIPANNDK